MLRTIPQTISFSAEKLTVIWKDGRECHYELLKLRKECPCAECRGGHGVDVKPTTDNIKTIQLVSWKKVGRYALQLNWSDNHDLGIYTYDVLRAECEGK